MTEVTVDISVSVDGFVAGPDQTLEDPLGENGMLLHEWIFELASWRARHGLEGGSTGADDEMVERSFTAAGAAVMGRRMFNGGSGPWADDTNPNGWWDDDPPFGFPVFVLTHHAREPLAFGNGTTFHFVADGIESAVAQARAAASGKNVNVGGGASVVQQCLSAGLVDELRLHIAPVLLGGGVRLFDNVGLKRLELVDVAGSPAVAHLTYRAG
jgi:dihydrofolate reductase